jgi:ubiquinone/menaquinone biosynthesis C-methylase UbiE
LEQNAQYFSDGAAYELFMGRWTRAVGAVFLDWVAPPSGARWLDIGCGTGVFTELVLAWCRELASVFQLATDKTASMSCYAEWAAHRKRSGWLVPGLL